MRTQSRRGRGGKLIIRAFTLPSRERSAFFPSRLPYARNVHSRANRGAARALFFRSGRFKALRIFRPRMSPPPREPRRVPRRYLNSPNSTLASPPSPCSSPRRKVQSPQEEEDGVTQRKLYERSSWNVISFKSFSESRPRFFFSLRGGSGAITFSHYEKRNRSQAPIPPHVACIRNSEALKGEKERGMSNLFYEFK